MSRYHDDRTLASDPGCVYLAEDKLKLFRDALPFCDRLTRPWCVPSLLLKEHLQMGDSRAALVMQVTPRVLVAAYTDELDCVAMLEFPAFVRRFLVIEPGTRLLTVNTYRYGSLIASDLCPGPMNYHRYCGFYPLIAEFLSHDISRIAFRKQAIEEAEWQRTEAMARQYLAIMGGRARNGNPYYSMRPARYGGK